MKRLYYHLKAKFYRWNYKRKYGKDLHEAITEYGKYIILTEIKEDDRRM